MRILIVSDTHRRTGNLDKVLRLVQPVDMLIHLGDVEGSEDYIRACVDCPVHIVAGNNDFFSDLPMEEEIQIGRYKVFLTHGHYYSASMGIQRLKEEALARGAQIVMFGHTHRPLIDYGKDKVIVVNPGSLSYPRQEGRRPSYVLMDLDRDGEAHFSIAYL